MQKKRYALVGTGSRARMFIDALITTYRDSAELVAFCDLSQTRMDWYNRRLQTLAGLAPLPTYHADRFDAMIEETHPDSVIVTTMDCTHDRYIVRAMELGCDVITEKPMTTELPKMKAIIDAIERTGRSLRVSFNYRYTPAYTRFRELVMQGVVGRPLAVDFSWILDTSHGADYFRRWHRQKQNSGGLLVHKASHHFDLVNWWIGSWPDRVFALGDLAFYGAASAAARGERYDYDRYTDQPQAAGDPFALSLRSHRALTGLYLDAEADSGYRRDQNVFGEGVTIEDTMAVTARYRSGALLSYCLVAYSPWEGLRVAITGDRGRVELFERHGSHIIRGQDDEELAEEQSLGATQQLWHFPMFSAPRPVAIPEAAGGHGGGDTVLLEHLFSPDPPPDPFGRAASHLDGAAAILVGMAANRSMETGLPVDVDDLLCLP